MFGKVSACTFSLLSFFTIEDFVKSDRGETGFCLILKISKWLLALDYPSEVEYQCQYIDTINIVQC